MHPTHSEAKQMVPSEFGAHALRSPELPRGFQQSTFKSQAGERSRRELQEGQDDGPIKPGLKIEP